MARHRVTHRDVAEKAGVSSTTVSYVLNGRTEANISEDTQKRVMEAAKLLGYMPSAAAQALVSGRSQTIGFVIGGSKYFPNVTTSELIFGILSVARQHNLRLLIDEVQEKDQNDSYMGLAQAKSIDGLIITDPSLNNPGIEFLSSHHFPVVVLGNLSDPRLSTIDFDNYKGARAVMDHLLSLGHTRIACITHNANLDTSGVFERFQAYKDALKEADIPYHDSLVRYGVLTEQSGYENMLSLLDNGLEMAPTAVFALADIVAVGVMSAIQKRGLKIPDQVAVAGFDDTPTAPYLNPPLTSVRLSFRELGSRAAEMLVDIVEERVKPGHHVKIPALLNIRESTDPKTWFD
jgi:LacI family transcriptional regulator